MRKNIENYCSIIGKNTDFVQGAGGNVSWKEDQTLWIKASGTWLSDANIQDIFVPVDLEDLRKQLSSGNFDVKPKNPTGYSSELRPSIETVLHAVMPHKVVSHTHLINALFYLVQPSAKDKLEQVIPPELNWGIVPYSKPGPELGQSVYRLIQDSPLDVIFLENHGVIIGGSSVEDVEKKYQILQKSLVISNINSATVFNTPTNAPEIKSYDRHSNSIHQGLALAPSIFELIADRWALYPDHIVFLGVAPNIYSNVDEFEKSLSRNMETIDYAIIPSIGVYVKTNINKNKLAMLDFYYEILKRTAHIHELSKLKESDITTLLNWDAEKYRQQIAK